MILTSDEEIAKKAKLLRYYGFKDRYNSIIRGFNSRLDEIQAALLRFKLSKLEIWTRRRIHIAEKYFEGLAGLPLRLPLISPASRHVFHLFVIPVSYTHLDVYKRQKPICPYGVAKLSVEKYLYYYYVTYGIKYTALRYANIYGPRPVSYTHLDVYKRQVQKQVRPGNRLQ